MLQEHPGGNRSVSLRAAVARRLPPVVEEVFRRSVWLAQRTSGRLTFFSALNLTEEFLLMLEEKHRLVVIRKIEDEASQVLAELVQKATRMEWRPRPYLFGELDGSSSLARFCAEPRPGHGGEPKSCGSGASSLRQYGQEGVAAVSMSSVGEQARAV